MSKQLNKIFLFLSSLFCVTILFALLSVNLVLPLKLNISNDLVYCPLQKTWVKRSEEPHPLRKNLLDAICMSNSKKQELAVQISLKKAFAIDEKGIFETLQKGVKALDNYREKPNSPNKNLASVRYSLIFLTNKNDTKSVFVTQNDSFSFALNSRPPTFSKSTKFDFQFVRTLDQISRNINPRSPPFSI